jgi:hypothetical protein
MRETTIASTAKPNEPDMTHVSLSDNDGEYCKVRSTPSSKQGRKRARGAVRKAEEKKLCNSQTVSTSASSKPEDVTNDWSMVDIVKGVATMDLKVVRGVGGQSVEQEDRASATRLCAEGGRATLQSAGSAEDGGGEASSNNLPCTGGGDVQPSERPKHSLWCSKCSNDIIKRQDLLLAEGGTYGLDAEWQEAIWGLCLPCSGMIVKDF